MPPAHPFDFDALPGFDRNRASVLLYHFPTDVNQNSRDSSSPHPPYLSPNASFRTAMEAGVSLQLSGHTHAGQYLPFTWLTERIYRGYHYGLKRIGDFQIYVHSGTGTWGAPFRSGSQSQLQGHIRNWTREQRQERKKKRKPRRKKGGR